MTRLVSYPSYRGIEDAPSIYLTGERAENGVLIGENMSMSYGAMLLRAKLGSLNFTAKQAEAEALSILRDNRRINDMELAYSPSTGAVGMRWESTETFRVFNVRYPMYGESELVTDWVSVGKGTRQ